jgi:SAM-dependent MidA family methyltransferase
MFQEIHEAGGSLSFARWMELALYHPHYGYYSSGQADIGKEGDFFTSVSVGKIYGQLLASICREIWENLGHPSEFTIVEQGAHDGTLAADILGASDGAFTQGLRYLIVEPFLINRTRQQEKLSSFSHVSWVANLEEIPHFTGVHLSNELLDAFPVHALRWTGVLWEEECVARKGTELVWTSRPITTPQLSRAAEQLPQTLSSGFRVEVNLGMKPWLHALHDRMERGVILTLDYGQVGEDRYAPHRADGTLMAYQHHERFPDPLFQPGMRDITAQVDFTALAAQARETGFEVLGYSDQHHFLVSAAEPWLRSLGDVTQTLTPESQKNFRELQSLLHPSTMGRQFKAMAFGKYVQEMRPLSCFNHQRPGLEVLRNR